VILTSGQPDHHCPGQPGRTPRPGFLKVRPGAQVADGPRDAHPRPAFSAPSVAHPPRGAIVGTPPLTSNQGRVGPAGTNPWPAFAGIPSRPRWPASLVLPNPDPVGVYWSPARIPGRVLPVERFFRVVPVSTATERLGPMPITLGYRARTPRQRVSHHPLPTPTLLSSAPPPAEPRPPSGPRRAPRVRKRQPGTATPYSRRPRRRPVLTHTPLCRGPPRRADYDPGVRAAHECRSKPRPPAMNLSRSHVQHPGPSPGPGLLGPGTGRTP